MCSRKGRLPCGEDQRRPGHGRRLYVIRPSTPPATTAILVSTYPGQPTAQEIERLARSGERPRKDYVELARLVDGEVIDTSYLAEHATMAARLAARVLGAPAAQVLEAFLCRRRYRHIVAWADRLGLPLALLFKLTRSRTDLVLISILFTNQKKAFLLSRLKVHTHLRAIVGRKRQLELAAERLGVPSDKLHVEARAVDERFWRPDGRTSERLACAVGWEARDYATVIEAVRGMDLRLELAVGSIALPVGTSGRVGGAMESLASGGLPPNVGVGSRSATELRDLYARSTFVVVPVKDVEFDAGVTALTEAMAMGKAVIATRTAGLSGLFENGQQGIYVPPGDATALREAMEHLLGRPEEAQRMGRAGRALVEREHGLDDRMAALARIVLAGGAAGRN